MMVSLENKRKLMIAFLQLAEAYGEARMVSAAQDAYAKYHQFKAAVDKQEARDKKE